MRKHRHHFVPRPTRFDAIHNSICTIEPYEQFPELSLEPRRPIGVWVELVQVLHSHLEEPAVFACESEVSSDGPAGCFGVGQILVEWKRASARYEAVLSAKCVLDFWLLPLGKRLYQIETIGNLSFP